MSLTHSFYIFCQSLPIISYFRTHCLLPFPYRLCFTKELPLLLQSFSQTQLTFSNSKFVLTDWKAKLFTLLLQNVSEPKLSTTVHKPPTLISELNLLVGLFQPIQPDIVQCNEIFNLLPIASFFQVTLHKNIKLLSKQIIFGAKMTLLFLNICNNLLWHAWFTFELKAHFGKLHLLFQNYRVLRNHWNNRINSS